MKNSIRSFSAFLFLFSTSVFGLNPAEDCTLIDHLLTVNSQWAKQDLNPDFLFESVHFENDIQRIQKHLETVEFILRNKKIPDLTPEQRQNRLRQLDILKAYRKEGQFPINTFHSERRPYFIDIFGTACAVGYLLLEDGEIEFAQRVQTENNYAYFPEMNYPEIGIWAEKNGILPEELALIQPTYDSFYLPFDPLGNNGGVDGRINKMITTRDGNLLVFAGKFEEIDGVSEKNIIAFDGENWIPLEGEVDGEIFDLEVRGWDDVVIAGDFTIGNIKNLARYDFNTQEWTGFGIESMDGPIYAVEYVSLHWKYYIGGDFSEINGAPYQNLAWRSSNQNAFWSNKSDDIPHALGTDGVVTSLDENLDNLLVGGEFNLTAPNVTASDINQLNTNHLAYWNGKNWTTAFEGNHAPVDALLLKDGALFIGGEIGIPDVVPFSILTGGLWSNYQNERFWDGSKFHGFAEFGETVAVYGDFYGDLGNTFGGSISQNLVFINPNGFYEENASLDSTVHAAAEFKGELYIAGDFQNAFGGFEINNLGKTSFETSPVSEIGGTTANVYTYDNQLFIKDLDLQTDSKIHLYNLLGQLVKTFDLPAKQSEFVFSLNDFQTGTLIYHLENKDGNASGKVMVFGS